MDALQISLLVAGLVIVAGIYLFSSRKQPRHRDNRSTPPHTIEPLDIDAEVIIVPPRNEITSDTKLSRSENIVGGDRKVNETLRTLDRASSGDSVPDDIAENRRVSATARPTPTRKPPVPELIIVLHVVAHGRQKFRGREVIDTITNEGLVLGDRNIFHYFSPGQSGDAPMYSIANMLKPGSFDIDAIDRFETPGLVLFMTLSGESDSKAAFDIMLHAARRLATRLDGELRDESRSVLTRQGIEHIQERITEYQRKRRLESRRAATA